MIEQDPSAESEAEKGSTVAITVSLGPGTVKVPKVNGLSVADAQAGARGQGLRDRGRDRGRPSSVPDGKVIGSNPSQGSRIAPGSTVELIASTGVKTAVVPNVLGLDRVSATTQLRKAGFVVNANPRDSDEPEDQVLEQDPAAGEEVEIGTEVTITYSSGVGTLTLDDYVGQKLTYAQRKLAGRGPLGLGRQAGRQQLLPGRHRALRRRRRRRHQAEPRRSGDADRRRLHRAPRHVDRRHGLDDDRRGRLRR